jgi:2-hydroxy-3-keto-5-methylthiopentenyl-1-phosphate phosphatase
MKQRNPIIAICYDFDGTLSPGNVQEYGFLPGLGDKAKTFWAESNELAKKENADPILTYMLYMIQKAAEADIGTRKADFEGYGKTVKFFDGVKTWFSRIKKYGAKHGIAIEHYIVSSGLREMIQGTSIGDEFEKIYACFYMYDNNDVAKWPAVAVNYTTKTQFLFRINKGIADDSDNKKINKFIPEHKRRIPFAQIIYIGDGETDVPCMKLVKDKGGHSIAVYDPLKPDKQSESEKLLRDKRVNYVAPADYSKGKRLDLLVSAIIDKILADSTLCRLDAQIEERNMGNLDAEVSTPGLPISTTGHES